MTRIVCVLLAVLALPAMAAESLEKDVIKTSASDLEITFIGHGSLMFAFDGKTIHVDPFGRVADYLKLPGADIIIATHSHLDHFDPAAVKKIFTKETILVYTEECAEKFDGGIVMKNGDTRTVEGIKIEAVAAYNIVHKRDNGLVFHPKGVGNGYVLTFGETRIYIAGDTENTPEMKALKDIDYAFLPMNLPYTMTPEMVADAAKAFKPKVLYPYHYGETDTEKLLELLEGDEEIEVRIRNMK
jgi:L-ascorbate metabolism protein UlaG (beta-lactamase superfamily)